VIKEVLEFTPIDRRLLCVGEEQLVAVAVAAVYLIILIDT